MATLSGRRILVTGGSAGLGAAIVRACAEAGAQVGCLGRDADRLAEVCRATGATGVTADVTDPAAVRAAVDTVADTRGGLDGLVNCAGLMLHSRISAGRTDEWAQMVNVNLLGVLHAVIAVLPYLRAAGFGDIVNISSTAADGVAVADFTLYAATKAALQRVTEGLRLELAGEGIRVAEVTPGFVKTGGFGPGIRDPQLRARMTAVKEEIGLSPELVADQVRHLLALPRQATINDLVIVPSACR